VISILDKAFLIIPKKEVSQLGEAVALAETAGYEITRIWKTRYPTRLGRGLIKEIGFAAEQEKPDVIIFYGEPQPSTVFLLIKETGTRVIDRAQLILEIFVKHAGSREAKLQIEMARIKHELPIIREFIRRSKMGELPGFLGPGGYAVDSYYRHLTSRLARLRRELEKLRRLQASRLETRKSAGMIHVAITGYASAGKTSLFNRITGLAKKVGPEYFTTLQPKHYMVRICEKNAVFIDTVGFIRNVPPTIIEAFYSTLAEIAASDVIIFVVDASEEVNIIEEKVLAGFDTLARIGASSVPVIVAANKIDLLDENTIKANLDTLTNLARVLGAIDVIPVSALTGYNVDTLVRRAVEVARSDNAVAPLRENLRPKTRS
jgi:GTP-binding protein HflX